MIKENRTHREKFDLLNSINKIEYDYLKLAEETTELSEVLIKLVTKPNRAEERIPHLIEELGDVTLRMELLLNRLGINIKQAVANRCVTKLDKLVKDAEEKKYTSY